MQPYNDGIENEKCTTINYGKITKMCAYLVYVYDFMCMTYLPYLLSREVYVRLGPSNLCVPGFRLVPQEHRLENDLLVS